MYKGKMIYKQSPIFSCLAKSLFYFYTTNMTVRCVDLTTCIECRMSFKVSCSVPVIV